MISGKFINNLHSSFSETNFVTDEKYITVVTVDAIIMKSILEGEKQKKKIVR